MGNYTYPNICFGWQELNNKIIGWETIEKISYKYDIDFNVYTSETNHHVGCSIIYGFICDFDTETGSAVISDENKNKVIEIYNLWKRMNNIVEDNELKFHLILSGDIDNYITSSYDFEVYE